MGFFLKQTNKKQTKTKNTQQKTPETKKPETLKKHFNRKMYLLKTSTALMRTYPKYTYRPLQPYYSEQNQVTGKE